MICTWDWQAIAGLAQAGAIVFAALVARSTVDGYFRNRSGSRRVEIAEESAQLAFALVHRLQIERAGNVRKMLTTAIDVGFEEDFRFFKANFIDPLDLHLPKCVRLREVGIAGKIYLGDDFELACRRIAASYEYVSKQGHALLEMLRISGRLAAVKNESQIDAVRREVIQREDVIKVLEGTGDEHHGTPDWMDACVDTIRTEAAKYVR